jgi:hypothetical protein
VFLRISISLYIHVSKTTIIWSVPFAFFKGYHTITTHAQQYKDAFELKLDLPPNNLMKVRGQKSENMPGVSAHSCNPNTQETEVRGMVNYRTDWFTY